MNIHFIGIGGINMSALAEICINKGYNVSGSDMQESYLVDNLRSLGAKITIGQKKENITDDINLVVYTAAISNENEEFLAAKEKNILMINRAAFLGQIMREYKNSIAVSGTHGKTTTTSMLSTIFNYAEKDPTILVGGNLSTIGGNVRIGSSENFITEACEYVDSFLNFNPFISIVLNIEEDHLDYFSGIEEIKASFNKFGKLLPEDGYFIVNGDNENTKDIMYDVGATIIKFGQKDDNDAIISEIRYDEDGFAMFNLNYKGVNLGTFDLSVYGLHNVYNATAAIIASIVSNIEVDVIKKAIKEYNGVGRRFEKKGYFKNTLVVDDYAHHPTEVKATLSAAKTLKKNKLWVVFQPHTYSRTKALLKEFAEAFYSADKVIITDIYAAREKNPGDISSKDLVEKLYHNNVDVTYIPTFEEIESYLRENLEDDDLIITCGAGPIYKVGESLLK
ncbi:MAG: UDP-N-acetylmuramate--L-alanine ligase [Peptostreptococcus porci]|uniref:UDP-N-acetylmuramate--L-alanine ligase n=1 Tax=Peptostreptococcus porci TaxID=2652282 RepID=A0A6N7XDS0_9FIRM|nr:UDP-N-acetylmuramate--L-alanine ligase [Peptostreptococcus porci]MDY2794236.1 UDP-N-acetylmuramate--L-alanine ligase [Peptostreptococcus porci]MDY5480071.1 UDP-N-acetylmuramate--L-alanine ligase [Peptostreptococcus porci]MST62492.1 UDP-N-acetylmuramate--L-alanine ligase [Peptostreptococcus porci]